MPSARPILRTSFLSLCSALAALSLSAQNFYHSAVTAETASRAGIYTPDAANVMDAVALNPAGLAALDHASANTLLLSGIAWGSFSNAANRDSTMRLRPGFVPFGAVGTPVGTGRWRVALALTPDMLSSVHWRYADSPGTAGADYGSQPEKSAILVYRMAAAAGLPVTLKLSLGANLGLIYNENTLVAPYIFQENPQLQGLKTLLALGTRGFGWGGGVGLTFRPVQHLELSAAWSSPVTVNSHGHASGNMGVQFQALGIPFQPDFQYRASVKVKLPQTAFVAGRWQATRSTGIDFQGDFANYRTAFNRLPIHLTDGSNPDINSFLGSSSFRDQVPLRWSDQLTARVAIDRAVGERFKLDAGYIERGSLVPNGTLTPLTGPIMKHGLSTGFEYDRGELRLAAAYAVNFSQTARVETSGLLAGEYSNSRLTVGTQALTLSAAWRLRLPGRSQP
jgi:long-subunit fatty acid transport protein